MPDNTQRVDDCECIYCHHVFDGREACNGDMDRSVVTCPKCGKEMGVSLSVEYMCYSLDQHLNDERSRPPAGEMLQRVLLKMKIKEIRKE